MLPLLLDAVRETLLMVFCASLISIVLGVSLGIYLQQLALGTTSFSKFLFHTGSTILNISGIVPFLLLMLVLLPLCNILISNGVSYTVATIIPLSIAGSIVLAQRTFIALNNLSENLLELADNLGANPTQTVRYILLPEASKSIIFEATKVCNLIVGFSTIAGTLGAGGLGQYAIENTVQQQNYLELLLAVGILIAIQQIIEYTGYLLIQRR